MRAKAIIFRLIRYSVTFLLAHSIRSSWEQWLQYLLVVVAVLTWGVLGYIEGLDDGSDIRR